MVDNLSDLKRKISFSSTDNSSPSICHLHKKHRDLEDMNSSESISQADPTPPGHIRQPFAGNIPQPYPPYQFMPGFGMVPGMPGAPVAVPNATSTPAYGAPSLNQNNSLLVDKKIVDKGAEDIF